MVVMAKIPDRRERHFRKRQILNHLTFPDAAVASFSSAANSGTGSDIFYFRGISKITSLFATPASLPTSSASVRPWEASFAKS